MPRNRLARLRPHWPHRKQRPAKPDMPPADITGTLRVFRYAALCAIAAVVTAASAASFAESYRGLFDWAHHHALSGFWAVALLGLAASVAGNVGHVAAHDLQSRGTAAVPPVAAFAALWVGLGVLKRVVLHTPPDALEHVDDSLMVSADSAWPDVVYGVQDVPSLRSIRATLKVGDTKARRVRAHLEQAHATAASS